MRKISTPIIFLAIVFVLSGFNQKPNPQLLILKGQVTDEGSGEPLVNVHVYVLDGEEETLTNKQGNFTLKTWQKLPLKLTVNNYQDGRSIQLTVSDPARKQLIQLSR